MNEELNPKPFRLIVREGFDLEKAFHSALSKANALEIDDSVMGGSMRSARLAAMALHDAEKAKVAKHNQAVLDEYMATATKVWAVAANNHCDYNTPDRVLAVFNSEEDANAALPLFAHLDDDTHVVELPFFAVGA